MDVADALSKSALLASLPPTLRASATPYFRAADFPAGAVVIAEGALEREMFVVVSGEADLRRGTLELGKLRAGDHFGELGLVAARPRAASVLAATDLCVARLDLAAFESMSREAPDLALALLRAVVGGLGMLLSDMTESVGRLLRERALPHRAHLEIRCDGKSVRCAPGTPAGDLLPPAGPGTVVVAALVGRRAVSVATPLVSDADLAPLATDHWEGRRIYRESLVLLALEAAHRVDANVRARASQPAGFAQRIALRPPAEEGPFDVAAFAAKVELEMKALVETDAHLREERWTVDEALELYASSGGSEAAELLRTWRGSAVSLASYGDVHVLLMGPLVPRAGLLGGFAVLPDEQGLLLVYGEGGTEPSVPRPSTPPGGPAVETVADAARTASAQVAAMAHGSQRWLDTLGVRSVGELNHTCIRGSVPQLIRVSEGFQEKRIGRIADEIRDRGNVRIVCIAGPSSSGKTTFIKRLTVQLQVEGIDPVGLSLDDYYVDRDKTPRDEGGEWDFEAIDALRLDLLGEQLRRLGKGEVVRTARYDFGTGRSLPDGGPPLSLGPRQILVLEGIHALNPQIVEGWGGDGVFRVFICPLAQLPFDALHRVHASDLRLLRRVVRDRHARGYTAAQNIVRWPSVRRGERRHIFPFQGYADAVFDSSLIYELSVLKVFAERYLLEVPADHPSYTTAFRLLNLTDRFVTIYPDHVPPTSILREFIGGSGFEY